MWLFRRNKYDRSARELNLPVNLDPSTDKTLEAVLGFDDIPEKTHRKVFCSEEKMIGELAVLAWYKSVCPITNPEFDSVNVYSAGYDDQTAQWFIEMDHLGEEDDFKRIMYADGKETFDILAKCVDTTAALKAWEPAHFYKDKDFRKHGMHKTHRSISKTLKALEEDGIKLKRKQKKNLRKAVNALEPWLGENFDNDIHPGQFFDGRKVDEDKSMWTAGFFDLPHLLEYTSGLNENDVENLKYRFFVNYTENIQKKNDYVQMCNDDTRGTMLRLIDQYLPKTKQVQKVRNKILKKKPKTFEQYFSMLNKGKLRDNMYLIESHLDNLVETPEMSLADFELMYQSGKLLRCLSSYANHSKKVKTLDEESIEGTYYAIAKQDQLEKAIAAADKLERHARNAPRKYAKVAPKIGRSMTDVKAVLEDIHERLYKTEEAVKQYAAPRSLENAFTLAA